MNLAKFYFYSNFRRWRKLSVPVLILALTVTLIPVNAQIGSNATPAPITPAVTDSSLTWDSASTVLENNDPLDWLVESGQRTAAQAFGPIATGKTYKVGDREHFFALNVDSTSAVPTTITATLKLITAHAYWWFEAGTSVDSHALLQTGDRFEKSIYPMDMKVFGAPQKHGVDADPHIFILHQKTLGKDVVGLFSSNDECPVAICHDSNQHDMLYVGLDAGPVGSESELSTVAHELQHLIRYHAGGQDRWLDEGLAQLAEHLNGFSPDEIIGTGLNDFLQTPQTQLNSWPADPNADPSLNYDAGYIFCVYLYQRFGVSLIQAIAASPYRGMAAISHALESIHAPETVDQVFANWIVTNAVNSPYVGDGRYSYQSLQLPGLPATSDLPADGHWQNTLPEYSAEYIQLTPGRYALTFTGQSSQALNVPNPPEGKWMWWSYNSPYGLTRLERALDLRNMQNPMLTYKAWWNIDDFDGDRGYVLISTDSGATWKSIKASGSQQCDLQKACYFGDSSVWKSEKIALSAYAGQQIRLRFEYSGESGGVGSGLFLTDFKLTGANNIGFADDVQNGIGDWQATGFMRITPGVPQHWTVSAILMPTQETPQVVTMPIQSDQTGALTITVPAGGALIAVAPMAPFIIDKASYSLNVQSTGTSTVAAH